MKREKTKPTQSVNLKLLEQIAYDRGFNEGAAEQRRLDIQSVAKLLEGLEDMPGIGEKTAWKIRELVMSKFGI
jgi:ERCC4-type nuclease